MKKLKVFFDWFLRIGLSAVVVLFLVVAPWTLFPSLLNAQANVNRGEHFEYQGILELWHVETFEGGSVSRAKFLERQAINFEKQNKGCYIVIQTMNLEQLELNIENNKRPNMISFGIGASDKIANELVELDSKNVRADLAKSGQYGSRQLAVPYILGGYVLIENGNGTVGVGLKGTTNPLMAMQKNNLQIANIFKETNLDSYDTYDKFLKGSFETLLGTQRDFYRVQNRQQKGLMTDVNFKFLGGYTDLVQYVSVFKGNKTEVEMCKKFVSSLIEENAQNKLAGYNLFSTLSNITLYKDGLYKDFEEVLKQPLTCENAFISKSEIEFKKEESYKNVVI